MEEVFPGEDENAVVGEAWPGVERDENSLARFVFLLKGAEAVKVMIGNAVGTLDLNGDVVPAEDEVDLKTGCGAPIGQGVTGSGIEGVRGKFHPDEMLEDSSEKF